MLAVVPSRGSWQNFPACAGDTRPQKCVFMTSQFTIESPEAEIHRDTLVSACYNIYRNSL